MMKEIYELLKRLSELEPERFDTKGYESDKVVMVSLCSGTFPICVKGFITSADQYVLLGAIIETIKSHGWKWHIGNDHGIENRPEYVAVITIDDGLYATEFGEIAIIALLRAYITALRAAERYKR